MITTVRDGYSRRVPQRINKRNREKRNRGCGGYLRKLSSVEGLRDLQSTRLEEGGQS